MKNLLHLLKEPFVWFVVFPIMGFLLWGGLNYTGFCWTEKRWLSGEEIIDSAIERIISSDEAWIWDGVNGSETYKVVRYKSVEDFKAKNPDCCYVKYTYDLTSSPFLNRISGDVSIWYPVINATYHYIYEEKIYTKKGNMARGFDGWPFLRTDNCGNYVSNEDW